MPWGTGGQLIGGLLAKMQRAVMAFLSMHKLEGGGTQFQPSVGREVEAGRSDVQGYPQVLSECESCLGYGRLYLKNKIESPCVKQASIQQLSCLRSSHVDIAGVYHYVCLKFFIDT